MPEIETKILETILQQPAVNAPILVKCNIAMLSNEHFGSLKHTLLGKKPHQQVCLVFQEQAIAKAHNKTIEHLTELKQQGILIGIEDFGHFRCDLNIITRLAFDFIILSG